MNLTEYKINTAAASDITNHLNRCNLSFNPPLNSYVNIQDYAEKIHGNAGTFEAWQGNELIGLVACYLNNKDTLQGHITNVSVTKEYQNKGIAKKLLQQTINNAKTNNFQTLALEVNVDNKNAIHLYQKLGFILSKRIDNKYSMLNRLNENRNIMVSICCITYNHEDYIREAIDGFLMQKTNFPIEVLIHDDASTDGTPEIIREYEAKYPDIIKPIYQTENQYSKGVKISQTYNWPRAKGKYIALCEGDDYWTNPYKLQKQVCFLEENPQYTLCHHRYQIKDKSIKSTAQYSPILEDESDLSGRLTGHSIGTLTMVFKNCLSNSVFEKLSHFPIGDFSIANIFSYQGKIKFLPDIMACYRIHNKGVWNEMNYLNRRYTFLEVLSNLNLLGLPLNTDHLIDQLKGKEYYNIFHYHIMNGSKEKAQKALELAIKNNPEFSISQTIEIFDKLNNASLITLIKQIIKQLLQIKKK